MTILLWINSLLLIVVTLLFACFAIHRLQVRKLVEGALDRVSSEINEKRLKQEVRRYTRTMSTEMSPAEKVELYLIDKSNIRRYIPFMNFPLLLLLCLGIFILAFRPVYRILFFIPSAAVICLLFSLVPVFILDIMGRYNSEKIRRRLAEFISVLNRWCAVKEDIFYAFEKSVDSSIGEPLCTFVRDMVIQVNMGVEPLEALDILQRKVDNIQFRDFIVNIKQSVRHRGELVKLLTNLEEQFYRIEEEYNRRQISTYQDRLLIYFVMFAVLFIAYFFFKLNPLVQEFYMGTWQGKSLLTLFCLLYMAGLYFFTRIMQFKN